MEFKRRDVYDMTLSGEELTGLLHGIARMLSEDDKREASILITQKLIPLVKIDHDFDDTSYIEFCAEEDY